jgi:hypothetical protein
VRDSALNRRLPHRRNWWLRHRCYGRVDDRALDPDGETGILSVSSGRNQAGYQNEEQQIFELHASTSMHLLTRA